MCYELCAVSKYKTYDFKLIQIKFNEFIGIIFSANLVCSQINTEIIINKNEIFHPIYVL